MFPCTGRLSHCRCQVPMSRVILIVDCSSLNFYCNSLAPYVRTTFLNTLCIYTSSHLDNRVQSMLNTSQASNLEGLHCEMHGIVEKIRIMNENNACLIQHLSTNKPPLPTAPIPEVSRSLHPHQLGDRESQSHQSTGRACSTRN